MKDQNFLSINTLTKRLSKVMEKFINEKSDTLDILIEKLESTNDPNPSDLYLLESLCQLREKLVLVDSRIQNYLINERKETLLGNKLNDLYKSSKKHGTSVLFDD